MAIKSSLYFVFDGQRSDQFGITNVTVSTNSSGLPYDEPFLANRTINEVKIRGRDKPYYVSTSHDALQFTLSFAFNDTWDTDAIRAIARWLSVEFYKKLAFSDNLDRVFYAMPVGESHLIHNGLSQGWLTITFRCDSPYAFSPVIESQVYDLSINPTNGTTIQFNNTGDVNVQPEMWIQKVGNGEVEIINLSNGGTSTKFAYIASAPATAPTLTTSTTGGSLPAATYYFKYTWTTANGETQAGPEASITTTGSTSTVTATIPTLPTGVTGANIYISTSSGSETKQGFTTTTTYTQTAALVSGVVLPTSNTSGLWDGETVYVDNANEYIQSDQTNVYRYANFSNNYLELLYGNSNLLVKGTCKLRFRYEYIYLQG